MKTTIDLRYLAAAAVCASTEKTRYYLNGVYVEITARGVRYIATDGHRMLVLFQERDKEADNEVILASAIIPPEHCKHKPVSRGDHEAVLEIDGNDIRLEIGGAMFAFTGIEGPYPDWRRILPAKITGETVYYYPVQLASFEKAAKILGVKIAGLSHNGVDLPGIVHFSGDDDFGLIMPVRNMVIRDWNPPSWIGTNRFANS